MGSGGVTFNNPERSHGPLPVLSDGRVMLRAAESRDLPAIDAGIHDPDVIRWIGPPEGSAHDVLVQNEERWAHGSPTLSICELDGKCVGKVWLSVSETDTSTGSIGYWLLPVGRGRGLATSAVRLLSTWAVRELGITKLLLTTAPDNDRSHRVAERSGFRRLSPVVEESPDGPDSGQVVYAFDGPPSRLALE
jgi:RimJ/RimL family protein N-acetyltransferase